MDGELRAIFNRTYSDDRYARYQRELTAILGCEVPFRLAESPVFLPEDLRARLVTAAEEIVEQLSEPGRIAAMKAAIPARWNTPGMDAVPSFAQVDFAIVRNDEGELIPRLIELQGFPSLTCFQVSQIDAWSRAMADTDGLQRDWTGWFGGRTREEYLELARRTICGAHRPDEVILLDIDPLTQKTFVDFAATKRLIGVDAVCPTELIREGKQLFRRDQAGKLIRVARIYNRVVFDELITRNLDMPFDHREELDVEWAPHPNWYWVWSKFSLPHLDHAAAPRATLLSDVEQYPEDLSRYVLKPLFSFAGGGVNIDPTVADLDRVPESERSSWCIQEKIAYAPALVAADGAGVKVEVRMMFLRPDDTSRPLLTQNLCRLSRGKMHGVDFNKNMTWVGSSAGIWDRATDDAHGPQTR